MEESRPSTPSSRNVPDRDSSVYAISMAADMLELAKERFSQGDMQGALDHSRDAIRIASSAVLLRDGYITDDFGKTVRYLSHRYDSIFPLRDWEKVEMTYLGERGLYNMLLKAMGKPPRSDQDKAHDAVEVAERFIETTKKELES